MPLTSKGKRLMAKMRKRYGDRAEEVFYAMMNKKGSGERTFHKSPDEYDPAALGETPPRVKFEVLPLGTEMPKKAGTTPAGVQQADGSANLRADEQTKTSTRASAGGGTTRYPAIDRFSGENV